MYWRACYKYMCTPLKMLITVGHGHVDQFVGHGVWKNKKIKRDTDHYTIEGDIDHYTIEKFLTVSFDGSGELCPEDQGVASKAPDLPEADNPDHSGDHGDRPEDAGRDGGPKINVLSTEREKVIRYTDHYTIELLDTDRDIYQRSVCPDLDGGLLGGGPAGGAGGFDDFGRHAVSAHPQMVVGGGADGGGEPGGVFDERRDL